MGKKSGSGSATRIRDEQPVSYFRALRNNFWVKILTFFDADPGWKKFVSGMEKTRIQDKHPGSATLPNNLATGFLPVFPWIQNLREGGSLAATISNQNV
jgi:hypothetical protein